MKMSRFIPMALHPGRRRATRSQRRHAGRWPHHSVEALEGRCLLSVSPDTFSTSLLPGGSAEVAKIVTTPSIPPNPDVAFLADTTGSMGSAIANVAANASTILSDVLAAQPTAQFSVSEYKDIGDPFEFKVDQHLTANTTDVQNGINAWSASGGGDTPEAQLQALSELANGAANWRTDSTRIIVWFGDSSGHDPSGSLGITLPQAISALQANHVEVIAVPVNSGSGDGLDSTGQATAITTATGGSLLPSATPDQVANAILTGLENLPITVTPHIVGSTGPLSVSFDHTSQTVTSGSNASFNESISVPPGTPPQVVNYQVEFLSDSGSVLGTENDTITVTSPVKTAPLSQGFWKNHPDLWPVNNLTLGTVNYTEAQLLAILGQPVRGNGLVSLAHQQIAAELNQANGAVVPSAVATAITNADALIGGLVIPPIGTGFLAPSQTNSLTTTLDNFNNGLLS